MNLSELIDHATNKNRFKTIVDYTHFCSRYLEFIATGLQAQIVSQNERHYRFFQYKEDGHFNITRPFNSYLMHNADSFNASLLQFLNTFQLLRERMAPPDSRRANLIRTIYTIQQSIGATLDALPSGMTNQARKLNGDLFERFIRLLIVLSGVQCVSGTMQVPIRDDAGVELCKSAYQHDLLISEGNELKIIGSVKTSSKDRIDKVFMDKFLYNKLTDTALPHIAIFLNDVQRKKTNKENIYGVSSTFLPGHFKAYTIKLNPLDGVYYCDIRQNMIEDQLLSQHIKTIDHFFYSDLWNHLRQHGQNISDISIAPEGNGTD